MTIDPKTLPPQDPALAAPVDQEDPVQVSSVDSFPASDPPGWIDVKPKRPKTAAGAVDPDRP